MSYQDRRKPNTNCSHCNNPFYRAPKYKREVNYCSQPCAQIYRVKLIACKMCTNTFKAGLNKVTCSKECAIKHRKDPNRTHCKGRPPKPDHIKHTTRSLKKLLLIERGSKCELCPYAISATLNIHHIKEKKNGGTDHKENLLLICPNCHAEIHKGIRKIDSVGLSTVC
jgi:hypothetical protein